MSFKFLKMAKGKTITIRVPEDTVEQIKGGLF
jgi:predicted DNA binding CopG/RHH family protein